MHSIWSVDSQENYQKFGYQILRLKCTKFDFGWGSTQTPLGELTALPRPLAGFKGPTSKGRERRREGEGRDEKENLPPLKFRSGYANDYNYYCNLLQLLQCSIQHQS